MNDTERIEALEVRVEKAEYKITDLIECIRMLSDPHKDDLRTAEDTNQIIEEKLSRQYGDMVGDGLTISLSEVELSELHDGKHLIMYGFKLQYVGDQA